MLGRCAAVGLLALCVGCGGDDEASPTDLVITVTLINDLSQGRVSARVSSLRPDCVTPLQIVDQCLVRSCGQQPECSAPAAAVAVSDGDLTLGVTTLRDDFVPLDGMDPTQSLSVVSESPAFEATIDFPAEDLALSSPQGGSTLSRQEDIEVAWTADTDSSYVMFNMVDLEATVCVPSVECTFDADSNPSMLPAGVLSQLGPGLTISSWVTGMNRVVVEEEGFQASILAISNGTGAEPVTFDVPP